MATTHKRMFYAAVSHCGKNGTLFLHDGTAYYSTLEEAEQEAKTLQRHEAIDVFVGKVTIERATAPTKAKKRKGA